MAEQYYYVAASLGDEFGNILDTAGSAYRRAAKFQNFHPFD